MAELAKLERDFRLFGQFNGKASPLYGRLSLSIADDPKVMALLHAAPEQQQIPVLLFAAMHDLLLRGHGEELAAFYPNLSSTIPNGDPYPAFRRVALANQNVLQTTIASRNTQTNEVGRCAYFLPVFGLVADEVGPLAHLDVGASAGLNLYWPSYTYRYKDGPTVGEGLTVVLSCSTRGEPPIPKSMPTLAHAMGLDMSPIDVRNDEAVRWLEACVWPDQAGRFERLVAAIAIARKSPPDIRRGDAVANVGAVQADSFGGKRLFQPDIAHNRRDNDIAGEFAFALEVQADNRHHTVAVHDFAALIGKHHAVSVAIKGQSRVCADFPHFRRHRRRVSRAAIHIDIYAVRFREKQRNFGAHLLKNLRRQFVGRPVRAVQNQFKTGKRLFARKRGLQSRNVFRHRPPRLADAPYGTASWLWQRVEIAHQRLDFVFHAVGQFFAVRPEKLDAIVFIGIM